MYGTPRVHPRTSPAPGVPTVGSRDELPTLRSDLRGGGVVGQHAAADDLAGAQVRDGLVGLEERARLIPLLIHRTGHPIKRAMRAWWGPGPRGAGGSRTGSASSAPRGTPRSTFSRTVRRLYGGSKGLIVWY